MRREYVSTIEREREENTLLRLRERVRVRREYVSTIERERRKYVSTIVRVRREYISTIEREGKKRLR